MAQQRLFEDLIESDTDTGQHKTGQSKILPVSIGLHVVLLLLVVIVPLLRPDVLPEPAAAVRAFFVEPMAAPAPPPPPPPPAPKAAVQPKVPPKPVVQDPSRFVAPVEVPEQIKPEEGLDL